MLPVPCDGVAVSNVGEGPSGPIWLLFGKSVVLDVPSTKIVVVRLFPLVLAACPTVVEELLLTRMVFSRVLLVSETAKSIVVACDRAVVTADAVGELSVVPSDIQQMVETPSMVQGAIDRVPSETGKAEGRYGGRVVFFLAGVSHGAQEAIFPRPYTMSLFSCSCCISGNGEHLTTNSG